MQSLGKAHVHYIASVTEVRGYLKCNLSMKHNLKRNISIYCKNHNQLNKLIKLLEIFNDHGTNLNEHVPRAFKIFDDYGAYFKLTSQFKSPACPILMTAFVFRRSPALLTSYLLNISVSAHHKFLIHSFASLSYREPTYHSISASHHEKIHDGFILIPQNFGIVNNHELLALNIDCIYCITSKWLNMKQIIASSYDLIFLIFS